MAKFYRLIGCLFSLVKTIAVWHRAESVYRKWSCKCRRQSRVYLYRSIKQTSSTCKYAQVNNDLKQLYNGHCIFKCPAVLMGTDQCILVLFMSTLTSVNCWLLLELSFPSRCWYIASSSHATTPSRVFIYKPVILNFIIYRFSSILWFTSTIISRAHV